MKHLQGVRKWTLGFVIGVCLGFGLAYGRGHHEVLILPAKVVSRSADYQAALLQCPVSVQGLKEWREACKVRSRMDLVR